jgi:hypothetical protein
VQLRLKTTFLDAYPMLQKMDLGHRPAQNPSALIRADADGRGAVAARI